MADDGSVAAFASAARSFAGLVHDIPRDRCDGPGLGEWDLRSLVGHTSRSLIAVSTYLQAPPNGKTSRPRRTTTCAALGVDPAAAVEGLVERLLSELTGADDWLITVIGGLGIRLHTYLRTRTFELAVHGLVSLTGRTALTPSFSVF